MRLQILDRAEEDLIAGHTFYEQQNPKLGNYFLDTLFSDIGSLLVYARIHPKAGHLHRALSHRFPFAIYYSVEGDCIRIRAVLDCRRDPSWLKRRLKNA